MLAWLRKFGKAGELLAAAIAIIEAHWGIAMSAAVGILAACWTAAFEFVQTPRVQIAAVVFLVVLWTWIGIAFLRDRKKPTVTDRIPSFEWTLGFEGYSFVFKPNDETYCCQIGVTLRNHSGVAVKYEVEHFEVMLKTRTVKHTALQSKGGIIPFGLARTYWCPAFPKSEIKDFIGQRINGSIEMTIKYGRYNGEFIRRFKMRSDVDFVLTENPALVDRIASEDEENIK